MVSSTERFSSRVENYVKYRPGYPEAVLEWLRRRCGLARTSTVADIGSGTGILTELLLKTGAEVFAVEPNPKMRTAAERLLHGYPNFRSIDGTAESTTLHTASADIVTAGQAFHWFDVQKARRELTRVLKSKGWAALVWNERPVDAGPFLADYEALVRRHAAEYDQVTSSRINDAMIREFFGRPPELATFSNQQRFDLEGLTGRLMSSSYAPEAGHPEHEPMIAGLREVFERHQHEGEVVFPYQTLLYVGQLNQE